MVYIPSHAVGGTSITPAKFPLSLWTTLPSLSPTILYLKKWAFPLLGKLLAIENKSVEVMSFKLEQSDGITSLILKLLIWIPVFPIDIELVLNGPVGQVPVRITPLSSLIVAR